MPDKFSAKTRSRIMSSIHGKDTKPEMLLRKALHKRGFRYSLRSYFPEIRCHPDMVMDSRGTVIFVDGCYWHKCPKCYKEPKSNREYWIPKIERNVQRDRAQDIYLKNNGWKVIRIWEHEIRDDLDRTVARIERRLR